MQGVRFPKLECIYNLWWVITEMYGFIFLLFMLTENNIWLLRFTESSLLRMEGIKTDLDCQGEYHHIIQVGEVSRKRIQTRELNCTLLLQYGALLLNHNFPLSYSKPQNAKSIFNRCLLHKGVYSVCVKHIRRSSKFQVLIVNARRLGSAVTCVSQCPLFCPMSHPLPPYYSCTSQISTSGACQPPTQRNNGMFSFSPPNYFPLRWWDSLACSMSGKNTDRSWWSRPQQRFLPSLREARGSESLCVDKCFLWVVRWEVTGDLQYIHYNQQKGTTAALWGAGGEEFV